MFEDCGSRDSVESDISVSDLGLVIPCVLIRAVSYDEVSNGNDRSINL